MFERLKNVLLIIALIAIFVWLFFIGLMSYSIIKYYIGTFWAIFVAPLVFIPFFTLPASYFGMVMFLGWHPIKALIIIFFPAIIFMFVIASHASFEFPKLFKPICTRFFNKKDATENDE